MTPALSANASRSAVTSRPPCAGSRTMAEQACTAPLRASWIGCSSTVNRPPSMSCSRSARAATASSTTEEKLVENSASPEADGSIALNRFMA